MVLMCHTIFLLTTSERRHRCLHRE